MLTLSFSKLQLRSSFQEKIHVTALGPSVIHSTLCITCIWNIFKHLPLFKGFSSKYSKYNDPKNSYKIRICSHRVFQVMP